MTTSFGKKTVASPRQPQYEHSTDFTGHSAIQRSINALDELLSQASSFQELTAVPTPTVQPSDIQKRSSIHSSSSCSSALVDENRHSPASPGPSYCSLGSEEVRKSLEELDAVLREYEEEDNTPCSGIMAVVNASMQQDSAEFDFLSPPPEFDSSLLVEPLDQDDPESSALSRTPVQEALFPPPFTNGFMQASPEKPGGLAQRLPQECKAVVTRTQSDRPAKPPPSIPRRNPSTRLSTRRISSGSDGDPAEGTSPHIVIPPPVQQCEGNHVLSSFSTCKQQHTDNRIPAPAACISVNNSTPGKENNNVIQSSESIETDVPSVSEILQKFKKVAPPPPITKPKKPKPLHTATSRVAETLPLTTVNVNLYHQKQHDTNVNRRDQTSAVHCLPPRLSDPVFTEEVTYAVPYQYQEVPLAQPPVANLMTFSFHAGTDLSGLGHPGSPAISGSSPPQHHPPGAPPPIRGGVLPPPMAPLQQVYPKKPQTPPKIVPPAPHKSVSESKSSTFASPKSSPKPVKKSKSSAPAPETAKPLGQAAIIAQLQQGVSLRRASQDLTATGVGNELACDTEDLPPPPPSLLLKPVTEIHPSQKSPKPTAPPKTVEVSPENSETMQRSNGHNNSSLYFGLPESELAKVAGFTFVPEGTPEWKRAVLDRRNKELVEVYLSQKTVEEREKEKWDSVPEWKRHLIEAKQAKVREESMTDEERRRHEVQEMERLSTMPEWKRNILLKKKNIQA